MLQLAVQEAARAVSCSDVVCLCSAGVSMVSVLRSVVMSVWGMSAAASSSAARSVCLCSAVIAGGRAVACSDVVCLCSAGISEVSGLRVEAMFVWVMPAAASSAASSVDAAAAAAVAADISAFLASIWASQSCSSVSAAGAAGELISFLEGEFSGWVGGVLIQTAVWGLLVLLRLV